MFNLKKLFSKKSTPEKTVSEEEKQAFLNSSEVKNILEIYKKETTMLNPYSAETEITTDKSKMGGKPDLSNFTSYPKCDACGSSSNFILQLYKKDFSEFYFPEGKKLFQLFRCPNYDCHGSFSDNYDLKVFPYYFESGDKTKTIKKTENKEDGDFEEELEECVFNPVRIEDHPDYSEIYAKDFNVIEDTFGEEYEDIYIEHHNAEVGTKLNGFPSWIQDSETPKCSCGKDKEFIFQLSSEDINDKNEDPSDPHNWSSHGLMIGNLGNIYFFVCKECGEKSIESYWDCG